MNADKWVFLLISGFIAGVALNSFFNLDFGFAAFFIFLAIIFILNFILRLSDSRKIYLFLGVVLLGFGSGILRYEIKDYKNYALENLIGEEISFKGVIIDEPDERENYTRLVIKPAQNNGNKLQNNNSAKILIYSHHYPKFTYGDLVLIKGELRKPKKFGKPDASIKSTFDWPAYLAKDDIYYEIFYPEINYVSSGNGSLIKNRLFVFKEKFLENLARVIPEPAASFLGGITVGAKKAIPKNLQDKFITTGIVHIVVLSGYNVTIIARSIILFFEIFTPRLIAAILGGFGIILFAIMTGGSPTVVRASIMALIAMLAGRIGRTYHIAIALFAAGFLMVLHNPKILRFDASFQLSFLATLGLIYLAPAAEKKLKFLPKKFNFRETASATISAQLAVTPLLLYLMGNLSVVALPVNLLILLFMPITMFFGFITGIIGFASQIISIPFAWIAYGLLAYKLWVVDIFSRLPFASIQIPYFPAIAAILIYGIIAASITIIKIKNRR